MRVYIYIKDVEKYWYEIGGDRAKTEWKCKSANWFWFVIWTSQENSEWESESDREKQRNWEIEWEKTHKQNDWKQ